MRALGWKRVECSGNTETLGWLERISNGEEHERELGMGPWGSGSRNKGVRSRSQCHEKPGVSGEGVREGVAWSD